MKLTRYHNSPLTTSFPDFVGISPFFDFANRLARLSLPEYSAEVGAFYEDDDNYYARFDLPGVKRENLTVDLNAGQLELAVKYDDSDGQAKRSVTVPENVNSEGVSAKLEDGVLTVTLPKAEKPKALSIEVN